MYIGVLLKYPLFFSNFNYTNLLVRFPKTSNIKFHENPSCGSRVVLRSKAEIQRDRKAGRQLDGQTRHDEAISRY